VFGLGDHQGGSQGLKHVSDCLRSENDCHFVVR
jgi:hypothetical protein